ncbi:hypothetical protein [uncultured Citricoccus sp.]|uniref:hypothetical protein n=1 Tax=uncultured Citricoccus sp. TaxID=614031 RepID=UPI0026200994|nr:hypothetical protein [uncultured Citricoccus sp.]
MTDLNSLNFETVNVPAGSYVGWGNHQGQFVAGAVLDYEPEGGTDFNDNACPKLTIDLMAPAASFNKAGERTDYDTGEIVVLNCGLANLKRAVKYANLEPGDVVRIDLIGFEKVDKGTVKLFEVKVARGAAKARVARPAAQPAQSFGPGPDMQQFQPQQAAAPAPAQQFQQQPPAQSFGGGFDTAQAPF